VIAHPAPGVAHPIEVLRHLAQHLQKTCPVGILIDGLAATASRGHVVQSACEFDPDWASHAEMPKSYRKHGLSSRPDPMLALCIHLFSAGLTQRFPHPEQLRALSDLIDTLN